MGKNCDHFISSWEVLIILWLAFPTHSFFPPTARKEVFNLIYIVHCQKKVIFKNAIIVTPGFLKEHLNKKWLALLLTSQEYCCEDELEDAVDEWESKHLIELLKGEGELDHSRTQLSVLHSCFQSNCAAPERTLKEYMFLFFCFALLSYYITSKYNENKYIYVYICLLLIYTFIRCNFAYIE